LDDDLKELGYNMDILHLLHSKTKLSKYPFHGVELVWIKDKTHLIRINLDNGRNMVIESNNNKFKKIVRDTKLSNILK
jgi:hypothetical protein